MIPELPLLDVPDVYLLLLGWPKLTDADRTSDFYTLMSRWAVKSAVSIDVAMHWYDQLKMLLHLDGTIDGDVQLYMDNRARAKMFGIGGSADPAATAETYLRGMSLDARLEWLTARNLLD